MKRSMLAAGCLCLFVTCATAVAADPNKPTGDEATAAAGKWLEGLGDKGLVLTKKVEEGGFTVKHAPSALGRITKFSFSEKGWWISFAFKGELSADTPVETLREKFWMAVLDRVPTPGLDLPGWDVRPRTPVSSFKEGVEVLEYGDGRIKLRVRTKFFAIYGRDPSVLVPADAPSPPGSYFMIRKPFPLDLTIDMPFAFEK